MKHIVAKLVLWLLPEQKEHRVAVVNHLVQTATNEPDFLKKVITGDESWVCDLEQKTSHPKWKSPGFSHPKKAQQSRNKLMTVLTMFFDWGGVVHHEYTPPGPSINKEYNLNAVHCLRDAIL